MQYRVLRPDRIMRRAVERIQSKSLKSYHDPYYVGCVRYMCESPTTTQSGKVISRTSRSAIWHIAIVCVCVLAGLCVSECAAMNSHSNGIHIFIVVARNKGVQQGEKRTVCVSLNYCIMCVINEMYDFTGRMEYIIFHQPVILLRTLFSMFFSVTRGSNCFLV